jgi:hypothetical protein
MPAVLGWPLGYKKRANEERKKKASTEGYKKRVNHGSVILQNKGSSLSSASVLQSTVTSHPCGPKGVSEYSAYTLTLAPSDQVWKLFPLFIKIENTKTPHPPGAPALLPAPAEPTRPSNDGITATPELKV